MSFYVITDESNYSTNYAVRLNFSAALYIGQHPIFDLLSAIEIRNGFKGCFRSLHINKGEAEIIESNEYVKLGSCSKKNTFF